MRYYFANKPKCDEDHRKWASRNAETLRRRKHAVYLRDKELWKERGRQWRAANLEKVRASARNSQSKHKLKRYAAIAVWQRAHPEKIKVFKRRWRVKNRLKARELDRRNGAAKRASKRMAVPKWVDRSMLATIYANCPSGYDVDHIVPLKGANVCGLHVPWNLQYLPRIENQRKRNKLLI